MKRKVTRYEVVEGMKCKGFFAIVTKDFGTLTTKDEKEYNEVIKNGYIDLYHD